MKSRSRVALLLGLMAISVTAMPASAKSVATAQMTRAASIIGAFSPALVTSSPGACSDTKYHLIDGSPRWTSTLRWSYKSSTTPSYLTTTQVVQVLKRAFNNITLERNNCGRTDRVSATSSYLGTTSHNIGVTKAGDCGSSDGASTIGFGALPAGYLALTCVRYPDGFRIREIDIKLATAYHFALTTGACFNAFMLEAVATHEIGHAYGLDHVGETNHGRLTMSTFIDGTCENQESTLGLGDMKGLEALY